VVEWRVFFLESAIEGISFPFFHDPPLLQSLKAARTQGNELEEVSEGMRERGAIRYVSVHMLSAHCPG